MPSNIIDFPKRFSRRRLLSGAIGAAALPLAAKASGGGAGGTDPVIALIAEEDRIRTLAIAARDKAEVLERSMPDDWRHQHRDTDECDMPGWMGMLYRRVEFLEQKAGALFDQIAETKPTTLAGVIAMLDTAIDEFTPAALAGLKEIAARGAA